jgi:uncharacterized membrane protein
MFSKIYCFIICFLTFAYTISAIEYDIQEIGTLQTRSSRAIAINNQGQILGEYNIDGTEQGRHVFVRARNGTFHEIFEDQSIIYENIPNTSRDVKIDWRYLTDDGKAYGTLTLQNANPILFMWDQNNGIVKLGTMPGREVIAINNKAQVLISFVIDTDNEGKQVVNPVIWENGKTTKLKGLEGDLGIPSGDS